MDAADTVFFKPVLDLTKEATAAYDKANPASRNHGWLSRGVWCRRGKRAKTDQRTALVVVVVLAAGPRLTFGFRDYREKQQAKRFVTLLQQRNYPAAYELWGCTPTSDCPSYTVDKFWRTGVLRVRTPTLRSCES